MSTAISTPPAPSRAAPWPAGGPPTDPAAASAQRPELPEGAQLRDLPYHRLGLADHRHRRWSPLVEGVISGVGILVVTILFAIVWVLVYLVFTGGSDETPLSGDPTALNLADPGLLILLFGSVAIWFPVVLAARWLMRPRPLGLIWSVTGRIRWSYLLLTMALAAVIYVLIQVGVTVLAVVLGVDAGEPAVFEAQPWWWLSLILMLVIVPIQCTAEELVFRGYLAQTLGRWLRHPLWAILLPAPLFMLGHMYDVWGQLSVGFMAVVAGWLTWKTGGLEAAVSLHVVNNIVATVFVLFMPYDPEAAAESVGLFGFAVSAGMQILFAVLAVLIARRRGLAVTRRAVVWPRRAQKDWEARTGFRAGDVPDARAAAWWARVWGPGAWGSPAPVALVPAQIPAAMAYHGADGPGSAPGTTGPRGSLEAAAPLDLVPADGLVAYASPDLVQVPGSDPPVYAHPVVWMARQDRVGQNSQV